MSIDLLAGIVCILDAYNRPAGTGFVFSEYGLVATCAHVIDAVGNPEKVSVVFRATNEQREAWVVPNWLRSADAEDLAILRVDGSLPAGVQPLPLSLSAGTNNHPIRTFGYPEAGEVQGVWGYGQVLGLGGQTKAGQPLLQLRSSEITPGFSGAPVWDETRRRVIGMVVIAARPDAYGKMGETSWATPTETLQMVYPKLQVSEECPYRSLDAFTEADAALFFGRQRVIDDLVDNLQQEPRFLAVLGPSGSGKSSVVQAGLIPQLLQQGALAGSDRWKAIVTRPFDDPFKQLAMHNLVDESKDLTEGVRAWLTQNRQSTRLVLVFDQFEELFVTCPEELRRDFVMQLTRLIAGSLPVTIILVMRDDFYSHVAQYEILIKLLKRGLINVPPTLKRLELIDIVRKPAEGVGLTFEDGLVETIIKDAIETSAVPDEIGRGAHSTILPLLEFTLTQLWERRQNGMLTHDAYKAIGGVTGGLTQWGDRAYDALGDEEKQRLARRIFTDLVHLGDESQKLPNSRQRRPLSSLWRNAGEQESVQGVVQQLVDARLLVTGRDPKTNEETVEIIHDALLREWDQLRHWLEEDHHFLVWHQKLQEGFEEWVETRASGDLAHHDQDKLLRGHDLAEAAELLKERPSDLSQEEREYIQTSQLHQIQEAQRWEQLYEAAEEQRRIAVQERQEAERQRQIAVQEQQTAEEQRRIAVQERQEAERQRQIAVQEQQTAEEQRRIAVQERQEAERQRQIALARQLVAQVELMRNQQANLLQRRVLLAVEAMRLSPSLEADQALRSGLILLPRPLTRLTHKDEVKTLALSPDGSYLVTANKDFTIDIWEVASGRQLAHLLHDGMVKAVTFSPHGSYLAIAGIDGSVRVWETTSGRQLVQLADDDDIRALAISPDKRYLATASGHGTASIWEVTNGRQIALLSHDGMVYSVTFSANGRYLATASIDSTARVWEATSGRELSCLTHKRSVSAVIFNPNERYLATASDDYTVRVWTWEATSNQQIAVMQHESAVNALTFTPDGAYLASASKDYTARVWHTMSGRQITRLTHEGSVNAVVFSSDGRYLATTSADRTVGVWETSSGNRLLCLPHKDMDYKDRDNVNIIAFTSDGRSLTTASENGTAGVWEMINGRLTHERSVNSVVFSPHGRYIATASEDRTAVVWEAASGRRLLRLVHAGKVWAVAFSPDGRLLATAGEDGTASIWETTSGRQTARLNHKRNVNAVTFSPDGRYVATSSEDNTAGIWETTSGRRIAVLSHKDIVYAVAFSPDSKYVATAGGDSSTRIWEVASGQELAYLAHKGIVNTVVFSPNGRYLATASWDHTARIWEASSGQQLAVLHHRKYVSTVVFSCDGNCVATASKDSTAAIWEMTSGRQLTSVTHEDSVSAVAFSPDGKYVATASYDHTAAVWEVASGRKLAYLTHEDNVNAIAFSPDGKHLATASGDGTAKVWLWRSDDLIAEARVRLTRNLTQQEWKQYIGDEPYRKTFPDLP